MLKGPAGKRIGAMSDAIAAQPPGASDSTADAKHVEPSLLGKNWPSPIMSTY